MPSQRRILVVDDEPTICASISARLRAEGYAVDTEDNGLDAVRHCRENPPDLMVLDVMLPGLDGLEVCRQVQAHAPIPVLMLTARGTETDMLVGLGVGADDYLPKPFSMRVLVARVAALLRRTHRIAPPSTDVRIGQVRIDVSERRVYHRDNEVHLTRTEFDLLAYLADNPRMAISRDRLLDQVWGWSEGLPSGRRTVDSHIKALRRKLGQELIRTVHGIGYALEAPR
ncbi:Putative two-component system response regulator [Mycobacteroides abscessus subsp. bolletii]|nr:DNA-binding response regulator [Mycobacteroides abscessus]SHQ61362.1 Putative two-component system response regulator [Mycobacteroides abscessus subsp. bolletii]SHS45053.1 Putative two-component system response regulator [Mycobacteroides abscessus subsp. bolletii]SHT09690.1 Putative two-component system response regulator [Mycobacteroides abscessus subsp. bolletii]SHT11823.1 Putative two-component system response regulator [Mycobacteroides abscessus subsp. bolletii]